MFYQIFFYNDQSKYDIPNQQTQHTTSASTLGSTFSPLNNPPSYPEELKHASSHRLSNAFAAFLNHNNRPVFSQECALNEQPGYIHVFRNRNSAPNQSLIGLLLLSHLNVAFLCIYHPFHVTKLHQNKQL